MIRFRCLILAAGWLALAGGALGPLGGCGSPSVVRFNPAETHGKVYYLDGIGCYGFGREAVPDGFRQAGYRGDVEYWSWSATGTPLDQIGGPFIRARGGELARLIQTYQRTYPGRPVSIIGLSGGTGVAVFACEQLPDGVYVDEVILVASSLSNGYNLSRALRHIRGGITSYQTSGDFALAVGVKLTGSIDGGPWATCAGSTGFVTPKSLTADEQIAYCRLTNVPYSSSFASLGFDGGHTSAVTSPAFVRQKFAPVVMAHGCQPGTAGRPPGPVADDLPAAPTHPVATTRPAGGSTRPDTQPDRGRRNLEFSQARWAQPLGT